MTEEERIIQVADSETEEEAVVPRVRMQYTFRQSDLPMLDLESGNTKKSFEIWKKRWEAYVDLSGLQNESAVRQSRVLQFCFQDETINVIENSGLNQDEKEDPEMILQVLKRYVEGQINIQMERSHFHKAKQQGEETIQDFVIHLRMLAATCDFCNEECKQKAIVGQMIQGVNDPDIVTELLKVKDISLEQALNSATSIEDSKTKRHEIRGEVSSINAFKDTQNKKRDEMSSKKYQRGKCYKCGEKHAWRKCPAYGIECKKCRMIGHFEKMCKSTETQSNALRREVNLVHKNKDNPPAPKVKMSCKYKKVANIAMLPDTGSDLCAASPAFVRALGGRVKNLHKVDIAPKAINGNNIKVLGKIPVEFQIKGNKTREEVFIFEKVNNPVLSWMACKRLGIVSKHFPRPQKMVNTTERKLELNEIKINKKPQRKLNEEIQKAKPQRKLKEEIQREKQNEDIQKVKPLKKLNALSRYPEDQQNGMRELEHFGKEPSPVPRKIKMMVGSSTVSGSQDLEVVDGNQLNKDDAKVELNANQVNAYCQPQQVKDPLKQQSPERPFQQIDMELVKNHGQHFLIVVDCLTDWANVVCLKKADELVKSLRDLFCRTAVPDIVRISQETKIMSEELQNFLKEWGVQLKTSPPTNPQSNGQAKEILKSVEKLIGCAIQNKKMDENKLARTLLQYNNKPTKIDGLSPAQHLFGHPIRDSLPVHRKAFDKMHQDKYKKANQNARTFEENQEKHYNQCMKEQDELPIGKNVAVYNAVSKKWDIYATIVQKVQTKRYRVKTAGGTILTRNRRFLRIRHPTSMTSVGGGDGATSYKTDNDPPSQPAENNPERRRSARQKKKVGCLVETPYWP